MKTLFLHYISTYPFSGYFLLFLGMIIEGDIALFASGFLVHEGFMKTSWALGVVLLGALSSDVLWRSWGVRLREKNNGLSGWVERIAGPFDQQILEHPLRTILITKFVYGIHRPILLRSGMLNLSKKYFWRADIPALAIWILVIGGIAYGASSSLVLVKEYLKFGEIALACGLVLLIIIERFLGGLMKKKFSDRN